MIWFKILEPLGSFRVLRGCGVRGFRGAFPGASRLLREFSSLFVTGRGLGCLYLWSSASL